MILIGLLCLQHMLLTLHIITNTAVSYSVERAGINHLPFSSLALWGRDVGDKGFPYVQWGGGKFPVIFGGTQGLH